MIRRLNITLISRHMTNRCGLNFLAISYMVKGRFVSSTIVNFTYKHFSKEYNISYNTLKKAINYGLENNLCHFEGKNLVFHSLTANKQKGLTVDALPLEFKQMRRFLEASVLRSKLFQNKFARDSKNATEDRFTPLSRLKKSLKICAGYAWKNSSASYSQRSISTLLNKSLPTTRKIVKFGEENGLFTVKRHKMIHIKNHKMALYIVNKFNPTMRDCGGYVGLFDFKGKTFYQPSNEYFV